MLEKATERFSRAMDFLMGKSHLTEKNIKEGLRQIKLCLLESDVDYKVVKDLMVVLEEEALGVRVLKSMTPKDQLMKVVYDKLVEVLGGEVKELEVKRKGLTKVMLVGLQGSGKTTTCVKLGKKLGGGRNGNEEESLCNIARFKSAIGKGSVKNISQGRGYRLLRYRRGECD